MNDIPWKVSVLVAIIGLIITNSVTYFIASNAAMLERQKINFDKESSIYSNVDKISKEIDQILEINNDIAQECDDIDSTFKSEFNRYEIKIKENNEYVRKKKVLEKHLSTLVDLHMVTIKSCDFLSSNTMLAGNYTMVDYNSIKNLKSIAKDRYYFLKQQHRRVSSQLDDLLFVLNDI
jgi:hypothetical protein